MKLQVIYEDEDVIALNKPSGLIVNKIETLSHTNTLQDWIKLNVNLKAIVKDEMEEENEYPVEFESRNGLVHRLDKDTSGIVLVAKNITAFKNLQNQFKKRKVKKCYLAIVYGKMPSNIGEKIEV